MYPAWSGESAVITTGGLRSQPNPAFSLSWEGRWEGGLKRRCFFWWGCSVKTWPTGLEGNEDLAGQEGGGERTGAPWTEPLSVAVSHEPVWPCYPRLGLPFDWTPLIVNLLFGRSFRFS